MKEEKYNLLNFIYSKPISFIIMFFTLLSTCYLNKFENLQKITNKTALILFIIITLIYVLNKKYSKFTIAFIVYWLLLFISTHLNKYGSIGLVFNSYYKIASLVLYLDYGLKKYPKNMLASLTYVLYILNLINFYTIVKYPSGWFSSSLYDNNWFFGYDNRHILMYFPAILAVNIYKRYKQKKCSFLEISLLAMITYSVFFCFSATSVTAYVLFLAYILFNKRIDKKDFMNPKNYFIAFILIFVFIILLRIQNLFSWLIVDILQKDLTFTNRVKIWDMIIELIKVKPVIGYGIETVDVIQAKLNGPFTHAHNTILDILYKGGICAIVPFFYMNIITIKELVKTNKYKISKYCSIILLCIYTMINFEAREDKIGLYIILILCYNIKNILDSKKNIESE